MTKPGWKDYLLLQGGVLIYSINTVCAKIASGKPVLSGAFIGWLALVVLMLGIYALIWQQSMKKIELSVVDILRDFLACVSCVAENQRGMVGLEMRTDDLRDTPPWIVVCDGCVRFG